MLAAIPLATASAAATGPRADGAPQPIGLLFVEQFHAAPARRRLSRQRARAVARHAASALANALEYDSLAADDAGARLQRLRWLTRRGNCPRQCCALLPGRGGRAWRWCSFRPISPSRRAANCSRARGATCSLPDDAIVSDMRIVAERSDVRAGDVLVTLAASRNSNSSCIAYWAKRKLPASGLAGIQAARLGPERGKTGHARALQPAHGRRRRNQGAAGQPGRTGTDLAQQQAELALTSPIDGQVLTWDVEQLLESRPVQRGKVLLTVGDLAGPWQLELRLPDHHAGYVLDARASGRRSAGRRFPAGDRSGHELSTDASKDSAWRPPDRRNLRVALLVTVAIDRDAVAELAAGGQRDRQDSLRPPVDRLCLVPRFDFGDPLAGCYFE